MRLIGSLTERQQAENFFAYLLTEGIHAQLESEKNEFEIWVKDEDMVDRSLDELERFRSAPDDPKYLDAVPKAKEIQLEEIKKRQRIAKNVVNVGGGARIKRRHPLTVTLIVICGIVALMTDFGDSTTKATFRALAFNAMPLEEGVAIFEKNNGDQDALGFRLASVSKGEIWRLVTPAFIHHGGFHIVFNMYWLFLFGSQIENRYGSFWFGLLVLFSAAISNFFQCVVPIDIGGSAPGFYSGYLLSGLGGMSGVVYALFGFVLMRMTYDRSSNLFVQQSTVFLLLGWLVFCMTPVAQEWVGNVANWAHAIGLLVGIIAGYWPVILPNGSK